MVTGATQKVSDLKRAAQGGEASTIKVDEDDGMEEQDELEEDQNPEAPVGSPLEGDDNTQQPEQSSQPSSSSRRRSSSRQEADIGSPSSDDIDEIPSLSRPSRSAPRPRATQPIASSSRRVQQTVSTVTASWSPDRKGNGKAPPVIQSSGVSARRNLRDRLKGFASQVGKTDMRRGDDEESSESLEDEEGDDLADTAGNNVDVEHEGVEEGEEQDELMDDATEVADGGNDADGVPGVGGEEPEPPDRQKGRLEGGRDEGMDLDGDDDSQTQSRQAGQPIFMDEADDEPEESPTPATAPQPIEDASRPPSQSLSDRQTNGHSTSISEPPSLIERNSSSFRSEIPSTAPSGSLTLSFDLPRLRSRYASKRSFSRNTHVASKDAYSTLTSGGVASAAGIRNKDSTSAKEALSRVISKPDFEKMEVLGQFNKGFIIARLRRDAEEGGGGGGGQDDLFIVDQHACDEKYNFETLQRTTVIQSQGLIK